MSDSTPIPAVPASQAKAWWLSRTLIVNALLLALAAIESQLHVLQPLLPLDVYALLAFALPVVNAALRSVTTVPIAMRVPVPTTDRDPIAGA